MLGPEWSEGKELASKGAVEISIDAPGCDFDTLVIIMNIFHVRGRQIPKVIESETLLNIALATDYLQCHEAVEDYGLRWSRGLLPDLPSTFGFDTANWIFISYTFRWGDLFQRTTMLAQQHSQGPLNSSSFPILKSVKGIPSQRRAEFAIPH